MDIAVAQAAYRDPFFVVHLFACPSVCHTLL